MVSTRAVLRGVRAASASALRRSTTSSSAAAATSALHAHALSVGGAQAAQSEESSSSWLKLAGMAIAGGAVAAIGPLNNSSLDAQCEAKTTFITAVVDAEKTDAEEAAEPKARGGRRSLLKKRTKHTAKLEEVDLMKIHLDEYRKNYKEIDSLRARFEAYATKTVGSGEKEARAMTFTNFLHSLILPRFHLQSPRLDVEYTCDFVGDANSLITYEECYLLIHLLQIPKEHFDVAFAMFDLDGDGTVDKAEFCHVIENLLRSITTNEPGGPMDISAETTLPRLTKYLFGYYGKKRITAQELETALNLLRKQILKAEFDLYAKSPPSAKKQEVISVHDFAITLISCFDPERLAPYLDRVHLLNVSEELVTWEDFYNFHFNVQNNLDDIKLAFELTGAAEITEADFIRATHVVSGVELSFPVVQLAFRIFDSNDNGTLDQSELLKVLEMRTDIELQKKKPETVVKRFWSCLKEAPHH